jgi:hypothetical protein
VYGDVPPAAEANALPLLSPHDVLVSVIETVGTDVVEIVLLLLVLQPFASVTVTMYVPAATLDKDVPVLPVFHKYVYGDVPPVTPLTFTNPLA